MGDVEKTAMAVLSPGTYFVDEAFLAGTRRAQREGRRAARAEAEARRVSAAQQENERQAAVRKQLREERIRRAQVMSAAEAVGVEGSSLEQSTIASGQTLVASGQAFASGASLASQQQSMLLQQAADYKTEASEALARQQVFRSVFDVGAKVVTAGA